MQLVTAGKNLSTSWSSAFITRLHRYKSLFLRRWWIPVLTTCLGLFVEAFLIYQMPPSYLSSSKMMLAGKLNIAQGAVYSEDSVNFYGTQIQLMQSAEVRHSAKSLVRSAHPELQPVPVEIFVLQKPRTSIFDLSAIGSAPEYTQAYLNAVMQKYLDFKRGMREDRGHEVTTGITEQLIQVEKDLRNSEDEMLEFQKQNNIGFIQEQGNSAAQYLVKLNQQYAQLKTEYDLLNLLDLDQNLDRAQSKMDAIGSQGGDNQGLPFSDVGPEGDYLKAKQQIQLLKAERETLARDLRPNHPKIIKLNDEITKQDKLIGLFRADTLEKLKTRRESIGKQMENLQANIKEWEAKALDLSQRLALFNRIKGKVDRLKTLYDRLTTNLKDIDVSQVTGSEDQVSIMEMATAPISVRPGLIKSLLIGFGIGALAGLAILILLDRIDDRMASFSEFLKGEVNWQEVVVPTAYETLFVLPRGKTLSQPSEHLLRDSTEALLKEIYQHYDYVIIDSSPVLAADDTTSLAPKIDATIFIVRLSYTSARLTKKALEGLYNRQVNIPGVILNFVDTSLPEYYYYQYSEYYSTPTNVADGEAVTPVRRQRPKPIETA